MPDEDDLDLPPEPFEGPADPSPAAPFGASGDLLNDVPLLRVIQRVLLASSGPVNWELARQIGIASSTGNRDDPPPSEADREGFAASVRLAELAVADLTGMPTPPELFGVEAVRRARWVEANVQGLQDLLEPVAARMSEVMAQRQLAELGDPAEAGGDQGAMLAGMLQQMAPLLLGA